MSTRFVVVRRQGFQCVHSWSSLEKALADQLRLGAENVAVMREDTWAAITEGRKTNMQERFRAWIRADIRNGIY